MTRRLATLALVLAVLATLGACRDGGHGDADCDPGSLRYCCWDPGGGERVQCMAEAYCHPNEPEVCDAEPTAWPWVMAEALDLDGARAEWDGDPCYVEDVSLADDCD